VFCRINVIALKTSVYAGVQSICVSLIGKGAFRIRDYSIEMELAPDSMIRDYKLYHLKRTERTELPSFKIEPKEINLKNYLRKLFSTKD